MKKLAIITLIIALLTGCTANRATVDVKEKSVKTMLLQEAVYPEQLQYLGIVHSDEIKKYAFINGGVIDQIAVAVGDRVAADQLLATLQTEKLSLSADSATAQQRAAQLDYAKAKQQYDYLQDLLADNASLLAVGAISQQQYDEVKLKRDIAQKELSQAAAHSEQARLQSEYRDDTVDDASLLSDIAGTVLAVNYEAGEVVAPGYPVIVLRGDVSTIHVGVTADDVKKLNLGGEAQLTLPNGQLKSAQISRIHMLPDSGSRTYTVEVTLSDGDDLLLGETIDVAFPIAQQRGIWLPIAIVLNDGLDYVYIVEGDRAKRVDITLQMIYRDKVMVSGLQPNDQLVVAGVQSLSPGYRVKVVEQVEQGATEAADE